MSGGSELDRRNFMKAAGGTAASITGLTAVSEAYNRMNESDTENILYGPHTEDSDPYDPEELSDDIDGLFLENSADYLAHPVAHLEELRSRPQYREVIEEMEDREASIYFGDVDLSTDAQLVETGVMAGEAAAGAGLMAKAGLGEEFSKTDGVISGVAGWLLQPFTTYSAFMASDEETDYVKASNNMHPESFAVTRGLRNAVVAYKQNSLEGDFGTVWGSLHRGFEERLAQDSKSLKDDIQSLDSIWKNFVGNTDTVSKAVELQNTGSQWYVEEVHEFPELEDEI